MSALGQKQTCAAHKPMSAYLTISVDLDAQSLGTIKSGAGLQQHLQPTGILDAVFRHDPVPERATVVA